MSEAVRLQDPSETLDHVFDWNDGWLATGETISTSTWSITPTGSATINSPAASNTTTTTTVWIAAVTFGKTYEVRNVITTSAGRTGERSFVLRGTRQ